jgi:hypothetical protein
MSVATIVSFGQRGADRLQRRPERGAQLVVLAREFAAQPLHLLRGGPPARLVRPAFKSLRDRLQRRPGIGQDRQARAVGPRQRFRIDVDADQLAADDHLLVPQIGFGNLGAHREHHVGLLDDRDGLRVRQHRAGVQPMAVRQHPLGRDGGEHDGADPLGDRRDACGMPPRPAADDHHRPNRLLQKSRGPGDVVRRGVRRARGSASRPARAGGRLQHVDGHLEIGRARPPPGKARERRGDRILHVARRARGQRRLGHAVRRPALVAHLVQPAAAERLVGGIERGGDHQHRHRIRPRLAERRHDVGEPRPGDREANAGPPRRPGIAVGHEAGALLVARQHVADRRTRQGPVHLDVMHPRNAEDGVDAIGLEQSDDRLADADLHRSPPLRALPSL